MLNPLYKVFSNNTKGYEGLFEKRIKIISATKGATGANNRTALILDIHGIPSNNSFYVQMEDDNSIWNLGNINKIKYEII